jgi:hypothetical protein
MKVEICKIANRDTTLCSIIVTKREAMLLIQSLSNQLVADNPNAGRLESRCYGAANEMTIFVRESLCSE